MKKILFLCCSFLITLSLVGQDFKGKAIYSTSSAMKISFGTSETDSIKVEKKSTMSVSQQDALNEQIRKSMQKEYELSFNKTESLYKEVPKLKSANEEGGIEVVGLGSGTEGGLYKNTRHSSYIENRDVFGKLFLVKDTLQKWDWKITNETKKIGNYNCCKVTAIKTSKSFRTVTQDGVEKQIERTDTTLITAWYTPEIPISQGPAEYWGLPGFILHVNDGKMNMFCSKIVLNPDEEIEIKVPSKGKEVDQATFKKIYNEKVKEMMKVYNTKRKKAKS